MNADMHPTDDDLVLHYYGELGDFAARSVEGHLRECAVCRESFARLQRVMRAVDALPQPEPDAAFERQVWARLRPGLRAMRTGPVRGTSPQSTWWRRLGDSTLAPRWVLAAGAAALVVLAAVLGVMVADRMGPGDTTQAGRTVGTTRPDASDADALRERLLLAAVGEHLERTEMVLIELLNARATGSVGLIDISGDQVRAEELLAMNRLFRQTAAGIGDQAVASMLDELERVLTEVAGGSPAMTATEFDSMRTRIEGQNILFKVQVISSELRAREREAVARRSRMTS